MPISGTHARVYGFGDLVGLDFSFDKRRTRNLLNHVAKTFDTQEAMQNSSLKPVLTGLSPDDLPLVGKLKSYSNVYVNVGHGVKASTLAFSTGHQIATQINENAEADARLSPARFHI